MLYARNCLLSLSENGDPGPWIICTALVVVVRDPSAGPYARSLVAILLDRRSPVRASGTVATTQDPIGPGLPATTLTERRNGGSSGGGLRYCGRSSSYKKFINPPSSSTCTQFGWPRTVLGTGHGGRTQQASEFQTNDGPQIEFTQSRSLARSLSCSVYYKLVYGNPRAPQYPRHHLSSIYIKNNN